MSSGEEVVRRAEPARRAGLLVEAGGGYEFSNDLIREVLYDTTAKPLRTVRHERLAHLLADRPEAAAVHASAAGDPALAARYRIEAAVRAATSFANREAEELLTTALADCESVDDDRLVAEALLARGRSRLALGHYAQASDDFEQAERIARSDGFADIEGAALAERAWAAYHARHMREAEQLAERAVTHSHAGPRATILAGRVRNTRGDLDEAIELLGAGRRGRSRAARSCARAELPGHRARPR